MEGDLKEIAPLVRGLPAIDGRLIARSNLGAGTDGTRTLRGEARVTDLVATNLPRDVPDIREEAVTLRYDLVQAG